MSLRNLTLGKIKFLPTNPVFRFLLLFSIGMILFYAFYNSAFFISYLKMPIVTTQANITSFILNILGAGTTAVGTIISEGGNMANSIDIKGGCDGIEATALLLCAVTVFPIDTKYKIPGFFVGLIVLAVLNLLRLVGLYFAKAHASQSIFDMLHEQGGFVIFTAVSILIWMIWVNWAMQKEKLIQSV